MFTGLVETLGKIDHIERIGEGARLVVFAPEIAEDAIIGDSIAINGCCLTVVAQDEKTVAFDTVPETLARTNLGELAEGSPLNLERSLQVGDNLGGHFVTGHIDAVGMVEKRVDDEEWTTMWFRTSTKLLRQMASKGSVAIDGVSLTLVDVNEETFSVALIPHTLKVTTLGVRNAGDRVNIETDVLAKYVESQLAGFAKDKEGQEASD